jgi:Carboxypeptidase regulatory-like domain
LEEVKTAKAIPNQKARKDDSNTHRIYLDTAIDECCFYFKSLKALILSAFDKNLQETKLETAGIAYYTKACSGNQGALGDLNDTAIQFIENNEAALKANNNMAGTFLADYKDAIAAYEIQRTNYQNSSKIASNLTLDNTAANNAIYTKMMDMFADAKVVFAKDPDIRELFTFTNVSSEVISPSVAGLRGKVTVLGEKKSIADAVIAISGRDKTLTTNKTGRYDLAQLASGIYTVTVTAKGFKDVVIENVEVKTGTYKTLDVEMEKIAEAAEA